MVISTKMNKTIVIRRNYLHYVKKYKRFFVIKKNNISLIQNENKDQKDKKNK
jgi:ribosomal protein S17